MGYQRIGTLKRQLASKEDEILCAKQGDDYAYINGKIDLLNRELAEIKQELRDAYAEVVKE